MSEYHEWAAKRNKMISGGMIVAGAMLFLAGMSLTLKSHKNPVISPDRVTYFVQECRSTISSYAMSSRIGPNSIELYLGADEAKQRNPESIMVSSNDIYKTCQPIYRLDSYCLGDCPEGMGFRMKLVARNISGRGK